MYHSVHGRAFGYDESSVIVNGIRVGNGPAAFGFGKTYFVDSGVDGASGASPSEAVGTIAELFTNDTVIANQGDTIVVLPGHAEAISASTAIDIAGVRVIGLVETGKRPA